MESPSRLLRAGVLADVKKKLSKKKKKERKKLSVDEIFCLLQKRHGRSVALSFQAQDLEGYRLHPGSLT